MEKLGEDTLLVSGPFERVAKGRASLIAQGAPALEEPLKPELLSQLSKALEQSYQEILGGIPPDLMPELVKTPVNSWPVNLFALLSALSEGAKKFGIERFIFNPQELTNNAALASLLSQLSSSGEVQEEEDLNPFLEEGNYARGIDEPSLPPAPSRGSPPR